MTFWSWMEYEHCTASGLQGPRVNLTCRWIAQHTASCPLAGVVGCVPPTCAQGSVEPSSRWLGEGENKWSSSWGLVLLLLILVSVLLVGTLINIRRGHRHSGQRPSCSVVHFPRHPGPGPRVLTPGELSIEFANVGGWLTFGDLALDSCAQFLAVAEHRSIPSRARSTCHQLRRTGFSFGLGSCLSGSDCWWLGLLVWVVLPFHFPSFVTPQFHEFFKLGRAMRTTLPTARGGVVHLFVVYGYQGAEDDADKLKLTDRLLQAILAEAQVVCVGQPMLIAGDLNADPAVIPCLAKVISAGRYVDLALAYSQDAGLAPDVTCRFSREEGTGSRRDFYVGCLGALAASQACYVTERWFTPHCSLLARFRIGACVADVACPVVCQPIWPACWLDTPDRSSSSSTRVLQDVWDIYREALGVVPEDVILALKDAVSRSSVDDFWSIWSCSAEAGLFRAYSLAGGPTAAGRSAFLGRGLLRIRSRRLGGRAAGGTASSRLYRVSHGDEVDKHCAQYFVRSSLSPVLLFRRRLESVADVLKGIRNKGFTQSRWDALLGLWDAVCRHGPCGPLSSLHPWDSGILPALHGFYKWVFDSLGLLNDFLRQFVVSRRDVGIRKWTWWPREDLSSRPYVWLRPDFVPPSPFLVIKDPQTKSSRILVKPHLVDAEFRKAWMLFFCRSGHPQVSAEQFLDFIGHFLPQENVLDLPQITGRDLQEVARAKKSTGGGLDGWAWNEIKALSLAWFSGLAILLELVESTGTWPDGSARCLYCHDS